MVPRRLAIRPGLGWLVVSAVAILGAALFVFADLGTLSPSHMANAQSKMPKDEFERRVRAYLLEHPEVIADNPRNPYAPAAQDVHEACGKMHDQWLNATGRYMMGEIEWQPPKWLAECPAPGTKGHPVPIEDVRAAVKESHYWSEVRDYEIDRSRELRIGGRSSDPVLARVRPEMFEEGEVERIEANRKAALDEKHRQQIGSAFAKNLGDRATAH